MNNPVWIDDKGKIVEPEYCRDFLSRHADSLYEQMRRMVVLSSDIRETMGQAAREKMVREFEKGRVVQSTIRALSSQSHRFV